MSELTDKVRRMLSQAQVFARDTPFEAVARTRQALEQIDQAIVHASTPDDRVALDGLRKLTAARHERYERALAAWQAKNQERSELYAGHERNRLLSPLRVRG